MIKGVRGAGQQYTRDQDYHPGIILGTNTGAGLTRYIMAQYVASQQKGEHWHQITHCLTQLPPFPQKAH